MSTVNKEVWLPVIEDKLFVNYEILKTIATDDTANVVKSGSRFRKVYVPQAGASAGIRINGTDGETVNRRTDTALEYALDKFETLPMAVDREDSLSVSYDKVNSVVNTMIGDLGEATLYTAFQNWYTGSGSTIVETSGVTGATTNAPSATGTRNAFIYKDLLKASEHLSKQKVPTSGRILLVPTSMAHQLVEDFMFNTGMNVKFIEKDGLMILETAIAGFKVIEMPFVLNVDNANNARDFGVSGDTTDNEVALAYHPRFVSVAKDDVHFFVNPDVATEYADVMSAQVFLGAKYRRTDKVGVIPIVQKA